MAKANSTISAFGITFSREERFGPATLSSMFGKKLPRHFRITRDGSVAVPVVLRYLQKQGQAGLQQMHEESEIVIPEKGQ